VNFSDQIHLHRLRRFEEETRQHESDLDGRIRLLESVVENIKESILITEGPLDGGSAPRIEYVNPAFTSLNGYSPEDLLGKDFLALAGPLTDAETIRSLSEALQGGHPFSTELLIYKKDQTTFWASLFSSPLPQGKKGDPRWVHTLQDISVRKAAKEAMERAQFIEAQNEQLIAELASKKEHEAQLEHAAFHDPLTGLKSRAYFMDRLAECLKRTKSRTSYRAALLYFDLDGFKAINDRLGHPIGDSVLIELAVRVRRCCRPQDTICRIGGDEFAVLVDDTKGIDAAFTVAQRILEQFNLPFVTTSGDVALTVSIGHCEILPSYSHPNEAIRDSDIAMYRAKREGGGRYVSFNESLQGSAQSVLKETTLLKHALEQNQFALYYQPIIDHKTLRVVALEALVRWQHPERGLLKASDFMPLAEKQGILISLGQWIFRTACSHLGEWQRLLEFRETQLSINISDQQFLDPAFFSDVIDILVESEIDPRSLQLEINQGVLNSDPKAVRELMARFQRVGIKIALTNFDIGLTLQDLKDWPVDRLKIDFAVVKTPVADPKEWAALQNIVRLAQSLSIEVSAEHVENADQEQALQELGCSLRQGYFYCRPLPAARVKDLFIKGLPGLDPELRTDATNTTAAEATAPHRARTLASNLSLR
jgi:diguanylate cyclase (GGDEF)-like protein/PAS domain S-box-containing protein